jgi:pectate lyase
VHRSALSHRLLSRTPGVLASSFLFVALACGSSDSGTNGSASGGGGGSTGAPDSSAGGSAGASASTGSGGSTSSGAGGTSSTGGSTGATGGAAGASGTGGMSTGTGGTAGTGGTPGTGGVGTGGTAVVDASTGDGAAGRGGMPDSGIVVSPDAGCTTPPPASPLIGWASENGGTTGGGNAAPATATTAATLTSLLAGNTARVIYVSGSITGAFNIGSNKTVVGLCGATIHGHMETSGSTNVIVRNLTIVGNNCTDSPADCSAGADAVTIQSNSMNVWFDHDDISDGSDGNLDITSGSDFVTISFTKFHYSTARTDPLAGANGHRFSNLIGSADTVLTDAGHLNVTWHHDWWADHVDQRMPRTRFGKIHVFNNLYTAAGNSYCTNAGIQASVLVENNVYMGVHNPLSPDANGNMLSRGNIFPGSNGIETAPAPMVPVFTPPYAYTLDDVAALPAAVMAQVGPH